MHAWFINSLFHSMTNKCKALSKNLLMWTWKLGLQTISSSLNVRRLNISHDNLQFA